MNIQEALEKIASFKNILPNASTEIEEIINVLSNNLTLLCAEKDAIIDALNTKKHYIGYKMKNIDNIIKYSKGLDEETLVMLNREQKGLAKRNKVLWLALEKVRNIYSIQKDKQ